MTEEELRQPPSTFGPPQPALGPRALVIVTAIVMILPALSWLVEADEEELDRDVLLASAVITLVWYGGIASLVYFVASRYGGGWASLGWRRPEFSGQSVYERAREALRVKTHLAIPRMLLVPVLGYLAAYASVVIYSVFVSALGMDSINPDQQVPPEVFKDDLVVVLLGLGVVLAAPLVEELFFRGFLFGGLRRWLPFLPAALISGAIFAVAHHDVGLIIPFTIVGVILADTYERTGTLYGSIGVHFLFNSVSFSLLLLFPDLRNS